MLVCLVFHCETSNMYFTSIASSSDSIDYLYRCGILYKSVSRVLRVDVEIEDSMSEKHQQNTSKKIIEFVI